MHKVEEAQYIFQVRLSKARRPDQEMNRQTETDILQNHYTTGRSNKLSRH